VNDVRHQNGERPDKDRRVSKPGEALAAPLGPDGQPVYDHVPDPNPEPKPEPHRVRKPAPEHTAPHPAPVPQHESAPPPPPPPDPRPQAAAPAPDPSDSLHGTLRTIKWGVIAILILAVVTGAYFLGKGLLGQEDGKPKAVPSAGPTSVEETDYPAPSGGDTGQARSVSCLAETGPDATTTSRSFADVPGTECTHRTGPTKETLVLSGKLTGRNTEGTGMSVTLSVNGKDCNGGEALSYARTYTPLYSNCTFTVPANSAVGIKWRYLSPFGGTAAVLRSSRNIAPSINGVAIPNVSDQP
jgi:hypothetical protein